MAGQPAVRIGHEGGPLLVSHRDEGHRRGVVERLVQVERLLTGDAEHVPDALVSRHRTNSSAAVAMGRKCSAAITVRRRLADAYTATHVGPDIVVFIPAWNEERSLPAVLDELRGELPEADVLVVDDGSTDDTVVVARRAGAEVLSFPENRGLGEGIAAGYRYALENEYGICGRVDADGQHPVAELRQADRRGQRRPLRRCCRLALRVRRGLPAPTATPSTAPAGSARR